MARDNIIEEQANNNTITTKSRYWVGVLYPENMVDDWESTIADRVQVAGAYTIHNLDTDKNSEHRKDHIHLILAFGNTTTYKHAMSVFNELSAPGQKALNTIQRVINIRYMYDYLIHDTETCKKQNKHLYNQKDRVCFNNFDIGSYEQVDAAEKKAIRKELASVIRDIGFMNYLDFYNYVIDNYDDVYEDVVTSYSGHFERLTKGNFQKWRFRELSEGRQK